MASVPIDVAALADPAVVFDDSARLLDWNEGIVDVTGVRPEVSGGVPAGDLFDDAERVAEVVGRVAETGTPAVETVIAAGDGRERLELTFSKVPDDDPGAVLAVGRRAGGTELREREQALRRAYDVIADPDRELSSKLDALLGVVRETVGAEVAVLSRIRDEEYAVEAVEVPDRVDLAAGDTGRLGTFPDCARVVETGKRVVLGGDDLAEPDWMDADPSAYLGVPVCVGDDLHGTLCFYGFEGAFSDWDVTFVDLLANWVSHELEREQLMAEIRAEERERYETLVEQSSDGVAVVKDGTYVFVNDRFVEITGYDRETLLGMAFQEVFTPEYRDLVTERYERRLAGESPTSQYDVEVETPDGQRLTLELAVSRIRHEGEPATLANFRDVTARKRRERAVRALQFATEEMQAAETAESVARTVVEAAKDVLDLPLAICWFHDGDRLDPVAATDHVHERDLVSPLAADRYEYDVFLEGAATTYTPREQSEENPLETGILLPLGDHGLLAAGRDEETEYDEVVFDVARTLAEHATTALDRIERAEEVRQSERRFRAIFNGTYQFMGLLEPDGTVVEANDAALEFGGLDRSDVVGAKLWEAYWFQNSADTRRRARRAVERAADGEFVRHELEVQGADREAVVDFSVRPVTDDDGEVTLLIPEGRDITRLKEREVELKRERDHVRRTEELAEVGGFELDLRTDKLRWTEGTRHIHELPNEFDPTLAEAIDFFHPEDRESVRAAIEDCRETGRPFDLECRIVTAKGRTRWVQLKGDRLTEDAERRLRGVVRDITEREEREQRLMVSSRVVRHNLRNKLSLVRGYAEQLESDLDALELPGDRAWPRLDELLSDAELPANEVDAIRQMIGQVAAFPVPRARSHLRRIQRTSDDLVALGKKIQRFERVIEGADFTGTVAVGPVLSALERQYGRQYPDATVEVEASDAVVHGNEAVLALAIGELIENGIKHSERADPTVRIDVEGTGDGSVRIAVADDGPGIPEMEREVLTKGEETPMLHGSGVGLWTVNWLMTRIGGRISITDDDPVGTVVTLTIPTVDAG